MKKIVLLTATVFLFSLGWTYGQDPAALTGTWKMVYQKWENPDTTVEASDFDYPQYKIFAGNHFSLSVLHGDKQFFGHFGKYSLENGSYTEHIKYSSYEPFMGQSFTFESTREGDTWTIRGVIEIEGKESKLTETWKRVE